MQRSSARDARLRVVPRDSPQPVCIIYDHHLLTSRELRSSDAAPPPPDAIDVTRWVELLFPLWILLFSLDTLVRSLGETRAETCAPSTAAHSRH
jgi:hypothetical protein